MAIAVDPPAADEICAYCNSRIFEHDPVCLRDCTEACGSPSFFCNHACLAAYLEAEELAIGDACRWDPESA